MSCEYLLGHTQTSTVQSSTVINSMLALVWAGHGSDEPLPINILCAYGIRNGGRYATTVSKRCRNQSVRLLILWVVSEKQFSSCQSSYRDVILMHPRWKRGRNGLCFTLPFLLIECVSNSLFSCRISQKEKIMYLFRFSYCSCFFFSY